MESAEFDHFVITRFSANFYKDQEAHSDDWLFYRLGFFFDALCASMAAQEGARPFTWLVYFDDRVPDDFRREVNERAASGGGLFEPIWTQDVFWFDLPKQVARRRRPGVEWVLTTRIDSDDAVARDYLAAVQAEFEPINGLTINFPRGVQVERSGAVYLYDEPTGPFQTYVERVGQEQKPATVFGNPRHGFARSKGPLKEVIAPPMWVQVIHGTNIANGVRGLRLDPAVVRERFTMDLPYREHVGRAELARERATSHVRRLIFWVRQPYHFLEWVDARRDRRRGTHIKPQEPGVQGPPLAGKFLEARHRLKPLAVKLGLYRPKGVR